MKPNDTSYLYSAREHLEMAERLRAGARKMKTPQAQTKLTTLASLYEQLSLCYLEESRAAPDRCADDRRGDVIAVRSNDSASPVLPLSSASSSIDATRC